MKKTIISVSILFLLACTCWADYYSRISGGGTGMDLFDYGGWDTLSVFWEGTGTYQGMDYHQTLLNRAWANVQTGQTGTGLWGTTVVEETAPQKRPGPMGSSNAWTTDAFTISAGDSGLNPGDSVQVRFYAGLSGRIVLHGTANHSSCLDYEAKLWKGSTLLAKLD
ncbi:MAG: hypothetical protein ABIG61_06540 [Planctomycetota bacterium]